nr:lysozyme inhibitor LprI family protein [Comamonas testosteroni]
MSTKSMSLALKLAALCLAPCLALSSLDARAAGEYSRQYESCMTQAQSTTATVGCIGDEVEIQDKRLNKAYQALMPTLKPERQKKLRALQRQWLQFRDANCAFYLDPEGGTITRITGSRCILDMTASRADELEALLFQ